MTMPAHDENLKCLLDSEIEPFLEQLRGLRYADKTVQQKRAIAQEFSQWALQNLITVDNRVLSARLRKPVPLTISLVPATAEPTFDRFSTVAQSPIC